MCLASFIKQNVFKIHTWSSMYQYSIAFYCQMVWMYHILFMHAPVGKHLGCLHLLVIINNAMNIQVQFLMQIYVFISLR